MVNERRSMMLNHMSGDEINEQIFKHHNFDGLASHSDLSLVARAEYSRSSLRATTPLWLGMTSVGAYNCTRLGVLSASGRIGAIGGVALGAVMTFTTYKM